MGWGWEGRNLSLEFIGHQTIGSHIGLPLYNPKGFDFGRT